MTSECDLSEVEIGAYHVSEETNDRQFSVDSEDSSVNLLPDVTFCGNQGEFMATGRENQPLLGGSYREEKEEFNVWPGNSLIVFHLYPGRMTLPYLGSCISHRYCIFS